MKIARRRFKVRKKFSRRLKMPTIGMALKIYVDSINSFLDVREINQN